MHIIFEGGKYVNDDHIGRKLGTNLPCADKNGTLIISEKR